MADDLSGDALALNGLAVRVVAGSWIRRPDFKVGARVRTKIGTLRSTEGGGTAFTGLGVRRIWDCQIDIYDQAEEEAVRAQCPYGQGITVDGYLPGSVYTAVVDVGDVATVAITLNGTRTVLRTASLHIEEV